MAGTRTTDVVVIGGGQAGLAMSRCLTDRAIDHVVLERGRTANAWRTERWDSLRLLTPNWMSRLPGWTYRGDDPDGYMTAVEVARHLDDYRRSFGAPVQGETSVTRVALDADGPDHFTGSITLPFARDWTLELIVEVTPGNTALLSTTVPIP